MTVIALFLLVGGASSESEEVSSFLRSGRVSEDDAEKSLILELAETVNTEKVMEFMEALQPTFTALPKNGRGRLEHHAVRYVLHRLFVARHGWYIRGLEPDGDTWHARASNDSMKEWVPAYLLESLERRVGTLGMDLHDLAALAAALEDLITEEASGRIEAVFEATGLSKSASLNRTQVDHALTTYLIVYLVGGNFTYKNKEEIALKERYFANKYKGWGTVRDWLKKVEREELRADSLATTGPLVASSATMPVVQQLQQQPPQHFNFSQVKRVAGKVGMRFGSFNERECKDLKSTLLEMVGRSRRAGRVRLADFYKKGLYSHWGLSEKAEYLETLGSLDKTNASNPLVIVANYLISRPNCLDASSLYAVCCRNECEDLIGRLERDIAAPVATSERIAQIVAQLSSPTVVAPRELSQSQVSKLEEIASLNGQVSLHGRLFAQWMHHAFPNECPYPHEAGSTSPLSPKEWQAGEEREHSEEELRRYVAADTCGMEGPEADAIEMADIPWSDVEELLVGGGAAPASPPVRRRTRRAMTLVLFILVSLMLLASAGLLPSQVLQSAFRRGFGSKASMCHRVRWQFLAVGVLIVLAFMSGVLDTFIFGVAAFGGILALSIKAAAIAHQSREKKLPI